MYLMLNTDQRRRRLLFRGTFLPVSWARKVLFCTFKFLSFFDGAKYQKNASITFGDLFADETYATGGFVGENSELLICKLEDGVVFTTGLSMIIIHGETLMRRVTEVIDRVVEADLYNYWISLSMYNHKLLPRKIYILHPVDGYYSFNLNQMQPDF
jgi:hypothetical protein